MRETIADWKRDWIEENGETHDLEVIIFKEHADEDSQPLYEGCFALIPEELLGMQVIASAQILVSSMPERTGAYRLIV